MTTQHRPSSECPEAWTLVPPALGELNELDPAGG